MESQLADALLRGDVRDGDKVTIAYDAGTNAVRVQKATADAAVARPAEEADAAHA